MNQKEAGIISDLTLLLAVGIMSLLFGLIGPAAVCHWLYRMFGC